MPSNSWNDFAQIFICLNSSLFPFDGWRNEKDAKSNNKLFASPFPKFQSLFCSLSCNIAARGPHLHIPRLNKSITICNSANSLSQIGNRLKKLHNDSLLIGTWHQSLLLGFAGLTRKGYIYRATTLGRTQRRPSQFVQAGHENSYSFFYNVENLCYS